MRLTSKQRVAIVAFKSHFPSVSNASLGRLVGVGGATIGRILDDSAKLSTKMVGKRPVVSNAEADMIRGMRGSDGVVQMRASKKLGRTISRGTITRIRKRQGAYK